MRCQKQGGMQVLLMVQTPLLQRLVWACKRLTLWAARQMQLCQPCNPSRSKRKPHVSRKASTKERLHT